MWLNDYVEKVKTEDEAVLTAYLVAHGAVVAERVGDDEESESPLTALVISLYYNPKITPQQATTAINAYISALEQLDVEIDPIVNPDGRSCVRLPFRPSRNCLL